MEVLQGNQENQSYKDENQYNNNSNDDDQNENQLNNEVFSKKKNLFRVEIRNKKTRTLLQAKRNMSMSGNLLQDYEVLPPFYPQMIDQTIHEFNQQNPNLSLIQQNLRVIRKEIDQNRENTLVMIKNSQLFIKLVQMITWGRKQPSLMFEVAYDLVINVTSFCDCNDVVDQMIDILIKRDENGQEINDQENNYLFQQPDERKYYMLSVIENHIQNDEYLNIRESAIWLLSNIAAENTQNVVKSILSKGKLFYILKENIELKNHTQDMLESIVNLLSNLSMNKEYTTYIDFVDAPELILAIFPLVINQEVVSTTLMSALKKIVFKADDDEVHQIINYYYDLVLQMVNFVQGCNLQNKSHCDCCSFILEIFDYLCDFYESLTNQVVGMGIFDPIAHLLNQNIPTDLQGICLDLLTTIFSKHSHQINDRFIFEEQFNQNQYLTKIIINLASSQNSDIKNSALICLSNLLAGCNQDQCEAIFDNNLMKIFLDSMQQESVKQDTITEILNGLINLIFIGNLNHSVEQNPFSIAFMDLQGDAILDTIQERFSDEGYYSSEKLLKLITEGNVDEEHDEKS
ncbi:hypothetical protein ABPG72_010428 [Tetrahymena utriculariae]